MQQKYSVALLWAVLSIGTCQMAHAADRFTIDCPTQTFLDDRTEPNPIHFEFNGSDRFVFSSKAGGKSGSMQLPVLSAKSTPAKGFIFSFTTVYDKVLPKTYKQLGVIQILPNGSLSFGLSILDPDGWLLSTLTLSYASCERGQ